MTPVPALSGAPNSVTELLAQLDKMIGGGKTSSSSTTSPDAGALDQEQLMLQKIFADINPASMDAMVGNIMERAKQTFGPAAISANAGGIRAYSDTVLASLRNEAMARATGEAVSAQLEAVNKANATAASLVSNRLNASKTTQSTSKTGPSTVGQAAGLLSLGSAGMNIYKKLKDLYQPNAIGAENLASGGEGFINDAESYAATDGGITSVEAGAGGTGGLVANSGSGGASVVAPPTDSGSGVMTDTSPFLSAESMQQQTTLAEQGTQGMGELSEVPSLTGLPDPAAMDNLIAQADQGLSGTGELSQVDSLMNQGSDIPTIALPSEAEMQVLNQQAAQAFEGSGELSQIPALGGGNLEQAVASLPGAEDMSALSGVADEGLSGAGELSEVPALSAQPSPGAGTPTADLSSTTTGVQQANEVIGADVGTPIEQILSNQGLQVGSAMPAAVAIDPTTTETASQVALANQGVGTGGSGTGGAITAADVVGADVGTPIEQILSSQGLTQGSAMPAAVAESSAPNLITNISALDTSIPDLTSLISDSNLGLQGAGELSELGGSAASGATSLGTSSAVAAGGEEAVAGGAQALGLSDMSLGPAAVFAQVIGSILGIDELSYGDKDIPNDIWTEVPGKGFTNQNGGLKSYEDMGYKVDESGQPLTHPDGSYQSIEEDDIAHSDPTSYLSPLFQSSSG